jgi:hypothetical protein
MAISALLLPGAAYPALPPASSGQGSDVSTGAQGAPRPAPKPAAAAAEPEQEITWSIPPVRLGGTISYDIRNDSGEGRKMVQRGLIATINAATETFIWQPWFAQIGGNLNFTSARNNSSHREIDLSDSSSTQSVTVTGNAQLRVLPQSRFPFEAHVERNDSRISSNLVSVGGYVGQRIGFTQHYVRPEGDTMIAWDRSTQTSDTSGRDTQDNLQLSLSHNIDVHRIQVNGSRARNTHERTGEYTLQNNLAVQHSYAPDPVVSVETMANVGKSAYYLQQGSNDTDLLQLSSIAFWRPLEQPLTVTGGVRLLTLSGESRTTLQDTTIAGTRLRNANLNLGATYDFTRFIHLNGSANVNTIDTNGRRANSANEALSVAYQPETKTIGQFQYNWSTSAGMNHRSGGSDSGSTLTLQLSHSLNRNFELDAGSVLTIELNQALSGTSSSSTSAENVQQTSTKQVTHGGAVSWSMSKEGGTALMRLSASDSRALDGNQEYFQLINFQASSNLPTSGYTSWSGSLTVQAVRQGGHHIPSFSINNGTLTNNGLVSATDGKFVTTSSGALTYQNQRFFGVRRLRFVSDLRLNGQALLPLFGGPQDQEMAAWENRWDYAIGRTLLRVNTLIARTKVPVVKVTFGGTPSLNGESTINTTSSSVKVNKSIMFSVTRAFGDN